ncbi:MAG TPA: PPOX class F420-dependent oxidoreductase [Anaerolineales bacterium]|nr:PPOX class F420-dependent oxidoreductase [Anaerolineales bacterium]
MMVTIPNTHLDLFQTPIHGVLTTIMPDGMPQSSIIWVDYDGEYILVNTTLERQKGRNMRTNPKVTILVIDPKNSSRWIEVRGQVREITTKDSEAHADKLTQRYCQNKQHFYGDIYPVEQKHKETRVIVKIQPFKIALDAIFK